MRDITCIADVGVVALSQLNEKTGALTGSRCSAARLAPQIDGFALGSIDNCVQEAS